MREIIKKKNLIYLATVIAAIIVLSIICTVLVSCDRKTKNTFYLKYLAEDGGSILGITDQTVELGGNATEVIAIPDTGYEFVKWSDGVQTPTRVDTDVTRDICVKAEFTKRKFLIRYIVNDRYFGCMSKSEQMSLKKEEFTFEIEYGEAAPKMIALPKLNYLKEEYEFVRWSDGVTSRERHDVNITSDMTITACFGYRINYKVNDNSGGKIIGDIDQKVIIGEVGEKVQAVANNGYTFTGWSDLSWKTERIDDPNTEFYKRNLEVIAYFERNEKTFTYDYGFNSGAPVLNKQITISRYAINETEFIVPKREGYKFCGWYADKEYKTRITSETGKYMYGYAVFSLESDTLYAKWQKNDEQIDTHKILLIFVDQVQAEFYSKKASKVFKINSRMSTLDYQLSNFIASKLYDMLNEWFDGKVYFEVDSYYTTIPFVDVDADNEGYIQHFYAQDIDEVFDVMYLYNNTITLAKFDDYKNEINGSSGTAGMKNAFVSMDTEWSVKKINGIPFQEHIELLKTDKYDLNLGQFPTIDSCLHELIHTAEMYFPRDDFRDLHTALGYVNENYRELPYIEVLKLCMLGEFNMDGEMFCVPMEYWKHENLIPIDYECAPLNGNIVGKIDIVGDDADTALEVGWVLDVPYGSDFSVIAVPNEGYRFVRWSDGVTTALRHDCNIIACFRVEAIFEKI